MKKIIIPLFCAALVLNLSAQPKFIKDFSPGFSGNEISQFTPWGERLFFTAYNGNYFDLWKSSGTPWQTQLVKADLNPAHLLVFNNRLFFSGRDAAHGYELWTSDGTTSGTKLLKDIVPGASASNPYGLTAAGNVFYFFTEDDDGKTQLWKSNGTAGGTVKVTDVANPMYSSNMLGFANGELFFWNTTPAHGSELWKSDGTLAGTQMIKDIHVGSASSFSYYTEMFASGDLCYFVADDGIHGQEVWRSDGTATGTFLLKDIYPGSGSSYPVELTIAGGDLFFVPLGSGQLWRSDGSVDGTVLFTDIYDPAVSRSEYSIYNIISVNGIVYFASDKSGLEGLWRSDGTPSGTQRLEEGWVIDLVAFDDFLFFGIYDHENERESGLWMSNGTKNGTGLITDFIPYNLTKPVGNKLFFKTDSDILWAYEPFFTIVDGFTLVNAVNDLDIGALRDGDVLNLAALPTNKLNIRADIDLPAGGSVRFLRNGVTVRMENEAPYAMAGDQPTGNYSIWTPAPGEYEVCATPYSSYGGTGKTGMTSCITFTVLNERNGISHFTLINADTDNDIRNMKNGEALDMSVLPQALSIRAHVFPEVVGSVVFRMNYPGGQWISMVNDFPYAINGAVNGDYFGVPHDYFPWTPVANGTHHLTATAYTHPNGIGRMLEPLSITFEVVNLQSQRDAGAAISVSGNSPLDITLFPNPSAGIFYVSFTVSEPADVAVEIFDLSGKNIFHESVMSFSGVWHRQFDFSAQPQGVYLLRLHDGKTSSVRRVIIGK